MAVRFSASTDRYRDVTGTGLPAGQVWSATCWAYQAVDTNAYAMAFALHHTTSGDLGVGATTDGTTHVVYDVNGENTAATSFSAGTWTRLGVTCNGTTVTLYTGAATGALTATGMTRTPPNPAASLYIGSDKYSEWFNGRVAAFKLWQATLTEAEITAELAAWDPVRTANLLRYYPFHVAELTDYSGNGYTLEAGSTSPTTEDDPPIPDVAGSPTVRPAYVADRGTAANATAATTSSVTLTSPTTIAVGNYLIARVAVDNSGTNGAAPGCTVTDPRSNTWTVLGPGLADPGAAAAGATAYLCYTKVVTAYQAADALTFNWGGISTTAKAVVVEEWRYIHPTNPVAVAATTNDSGTAGSTTAVTISRTPTGVDQMVYTCLATEGIAGDTVGADSDTTNGSWAALTTAASANATATNNQRVSGAYKVVTAAGAQSWDSTITSRDWAAVAVVFNPPNLPPPISLINREALTRSHYW